MLEKILILGILWKLEIVYKNGIQYLISIEEDENNILALTISRIDGQSYTSDDIIYFTLTYIAIGSYQCVYVRILK